nr:TonB-dependent receptor [Caulobacter hibisci]
MAGASILSLATSAQAFAAETASAATPDPEPSNVVTEIVVTGEKREVTLQKAALAISVLSPEKLAAANVQQLSDLNGYVPGLTVAKSGGYVRVVSIRGVGYEASDNLSAVPGTSFHVDGVYVVSPYALTTDFLDIARLEVLRGPQGTVFGQSATGGVLNSITTKPNSDTVSGFGELSLGDYNLVKASGAVNLPISQTLSARISASSYTHDGFATQTGLADYDLDDANHNSARVALRWEPNAQFSAQLSAQIFRADEHGAAQKNLDDPDTDPRRISQDYPNRYELDFFLTYLDLQYDFGDVALKSLTSYQRTRNHNQVDTDRLNYAAYGLYDHMPYWDNSVDAYSQEFNLSSQGERRLDYIVGAYALYQKLGQDILEFVGSDANPTYSLSLPLTFANYPYNLDYALNSRQQRYSYAAFAQGTFHVTEALRATLGLRYNYDRFTSVNETLFNIFSPASHQKTDAKALTGKAELDYDLTPRSMLYASVSRGYKPGGVSNNSAPALVPLTFEPEFVWAYELGAKNRFLDNRLTLNAAAFYYDYKNLQYQEEDPVPYQGGVANIPESHIWGAEAELNWRLSSSLHLAANATTLDGEMVGDYFALDPSRAHDATLAAAALGYGPFDAYTIGLRAQQVRNTNGNKPPKLPKAQGAITLTHTADVGPGQLRSWAEALYRGGFQYRIFNDGARDRVPGYTAVNIGAEYALTDRPVTLRLSVTNLLDKAGVNSRYTNPFGRFTTSQEYIAPRQVIATVRYEF